MPTPDTQHADELPCCSRCGTSLDRLNVVEHEGRGSEGYHSLLQLVCGGWIGNRPCATVYDPDDVAAMYEALERDAAAA